MEFQSDAPGKYKELVSRMNLAWSKCRKRITILQDRSTASWELEYEIRSGLGRGQIIFFIRKLLKKLKTVIYQVFLWKDVIHYINPSILFKVKRMKIYKISNENRARSWKLLCKGTATEHTCNFLATALKHGEMDHFIWKCKLKTDLGRIEKLEIRRIIKDSIKTENTLGHIYKQWENMQLLKKVIGILLWNVVK